jgi:tetratricopeptide (TPR) repeat protein
MSASTVPSVASGHHHHNHHHHHHDVMSESGIDQPVAIHNLERLPDYLPTESQMVLMCLDYLRDLRRAFGSPQDLLDAEGLHADWITLAIFALNQAFDGEKTSIMSKHKQQQHRRNNRHNNNNNNPNVDDDGGAPSVCHTLLPVFNDSWMDSHKVLTEASPSVQRMMMDPKPSPNLANLPSMDEMTHMILYSENPFPDGANDTSTDGGGGGNNDSFGSRGNNRSKKKSTGIDEKKSSGDSPSDDVLDSYSWYEYDDSHPCNAHRFYLLNGLAGSVNGHRGGPVMLAEIAAAGLCQLQAKSRADAEDEMIRSPLFEQFVSAVRSKGFFQDPDNETPRDDPREEEERIRNQQAVYDERMAKVVSKFRNKLAGKVDLSDASIDGSGVGGSGGISVLADRLHNRRIKRVIQARKMYRNNASTPQGPTTFSAALTRIQPGGIEAKAQEEAERFKSQGNAYMQQKDYQSASDCYTQALRISPSGPQSHVYFSNRAAALLSMKKFDQAILDSERALALKPTYAKAHARLGLAHFLLGDYRQAMEAYTVALKYEPDNKSSQSYLEKAAKKVAAMNPGGTPTADVGGAQSSFSVVSEWGKSRGGHNHSQQQLHQDDNTPRAKPRTPLTAVPGMANAHAEKHKTLGNSYMANREYKAAYDSYTAAIELSPDGPQSHVYYSNRAAALCYLEQYTEAANDSELALKLRPTYGKAHARLGLSRFFLGDYEGSVEAYEAALSYDPNNAASKSYLAKARAKLELQRQEELPAINVGEDARRLMHDPDMMLMAKKALYARSDEQLLQDPEVAKIAKRALADPTMLEAIHSIQHVDFSAVRKQEGVSRNDSSASSSGSGGSGEAGAGRVPAAIQ